MTCCKRVRDVVVAGWCVSNEQRFSYLPTVLRTCRPANGRIPAGARANRLLPDAEVK